MLIPFVLTVTYLALIVLLALSLARIVWRSRERSSDLSEQGSISTKTDSRVYGTTRANGWLHNAGSLFAMLLLVVFGFHAYWVFWADAKGSKFSKAKAFDARNRRLAESGLKGWVLDRSGKLESALIRYRYDGRTLV